MPLKQHDRQYDVVVFGATGYTGKFTAQHIATHLPTDLRWAVAGRSREKLEQVVAQCSEWNPDRCQPKIEICNLDDEGLAKLAKKTFILITTVGPYGRLGEYAFRACAENGTHYLDVTGEVPFVARMIAKHEAAAKASGARLFPQIGIESAPSDLITWTLASLIRREFSADTRDVIVSLHTLRGTPSGGTLSTALTLFDNFSLSEVRAAHRPFALSPIPNPRPASPQPAPSLLTRLSGLITIPPLGLLTSSIAAKTDAAIVERTWGLLAHDKTQAYGPNFAYKQYMHARGVLAGISAHFGLFVFGLVLVTPFLRRLVARRVYQPGEGAAVDEYKRDEIEYRAIGRPDVAGGGDERQAFCRAWFKGGNYYFTGVLLAEAAATLLQDDIKLPGGIYTPACLGQPFIDRLDKAGFHFETSIIPA
ncbi:Saccharopine dehydrogenase-domain-containing protein [Lasiosphaeris hirsuta]|uniref:Saccharopine dehydrogenase-domain-containing protein n=1 Tax=Lasiosphaeris hirsuta TaxID=260670 RepID=A0AA40DS61_9PEZI|nr:Saccharopine dehydrogenase-domain-containing protein [Lasiosphaeris hirsuta]